MVYGLDVSRTVGFSLFRTVGPISGRALHIRNSPFIKSFVPPVVGPSPSAEPTPARLSVSPPPPSHLSNRAEIQNESSESVPMNTRTQLEYLLGPSASAFGKNQLFQKLVTRGRFWNRSLEVQRPNSVPLRTRFSSLWARQRNLSLTSFLLLTTSNRHHINMS